MNGGAAGLARLQRAALLAGLLGIAVAALGAVLHYDAFLRAYAVALLIWLQLPLGCLAILLAWHIMGGRWGLVLGEALEAAVRTLPLLALLFVPLLFDLDAVYAWAREGYLAEHPIVARKAAWLDPGFFIIRTVFYFALWIGLALVLTTPRRPAHERPLDRAVAIAGAIVFAITATLASIDWMMSIEPEFNSSIYGLLAMSAQAVGAFAFAILATLLASERSAHADLFGEEGSIGLGTLLYSLTLLWIYHAAMQLIVIWSGDLPHNAAWYLRRLDGPWHLAAWVIGVGHFAVPFLVFLSARARQSWRVVAPVAALLLAMRLLDWLWMLVPGFETEAPPAWLVTGALLAVGGLWLAAFLRSMARRAGSTARALEEARRG